MVLTLENDSFDIFETDESFIKIPFLDETLKETFNFSLCFREYIYKNYMKCFQQGFPDFLQSLNVSLQ
jgi:hypothetical protein